MSDMKRLAAAVIVMAATALDGSIKGIRSFDVPVAFKRKEQTESAMGWSGLPQAGNKIGAMLFEVWVPKDAPSGLYKGTVSVMEGATEAAKLNVELTVLGFAMPDMPTFAFDLLDCDFLWRKTPTAEGNRMDRPWVEGVASEHGLPAGGCLPGA